MDPAAVVSDPVAPALSNEQLTELLTLLPSSDSV